MGNPFQVKLSQMLSAANTDLPRLEALLYLCCSHASLRCPYTQKPCDQRCIIHLEQAGNSLIFIPFKDVQHPFSFYFGAG